jgi:short-subunit dehydrogenase
MKPGRGRMKDLRDRRALVTGASRGIGPHIARALARAGAQLAVTARSAASLRGLVEELEASGVRAIGVSADLRSAADRARLVAETRNALGGIDILVNNAAIDSSGAFTTLTPETVANTIETNLAAPIHLTGLVLPDMLERRTGHVVNIASLAGKKAVPYEALYGGTKAGLIEWTSALRIELRGSGVSLSAICPGYVTGEGMFARWGVAPHPLFGSCTPAAVARAVVRAIEKDRPEVVVNSMPVRSWLAFYALAPGLAGTFVDLLGLTRFQRRKVGAGA